MRRFLLALAVCAVPAAAVAFAACVDGGRVTVNASGADATTGADVVTPDAPAVDAPEELAVADVCGKPPWVTLGIVVVALTIDNPDGAPLGGAQFTSPLCPGLVQYSDDAGVITGQVSANTPFYGRLEANGFIPELAPELEFDADSTGHKIQMLPTLIEAIILPTFDASASTAIVLAAEKLVDDAGPCSTLDGISYSVPGHPEAQVTYFAPGTIPTPIAGGTATSTSGLAAITGLAGNQLVTLAATKTGCSVVFDRNSLTGRIPLETGFVSLMPAYLSP